MSFAIAEARPTIQEMDQSVQQQKMKEVIEETCYEIQDIEI